MVIDAKGVAGEHICGKSSNVADSDLMNMGFDGGENGRYEDSVDDDAGNRRGVFHYFSSTPLSILPLRLIRTILSMLFIFYKFSTDENHYAISKPQQEVSTLHESFHQTVSTSKKRAILCTVIKDPKLRYIDEWADYHMALGFTSLRLYDNTDSFALNNWGRNKSYASHIERIHFLPGVTHNITHFKNGGSEVQSTAFMDCVSSAKENNIDWIAGFDIDEFLILRSTPFSIVDFMDQYCQYPCGQISFNWLLFGSSNRSKYAPVPVTK